MRVKSYQKLSPLELLELSEKLRTKLALKDEQKELLAELLEVERELTLREEQT